MSDKQARAITIMNTIAITLAIVSLVFSFLGWWSMR